MFTLLHNKYWVWSGKMRVNAQVVAVAVVKPGVGREGIRGEVSMLA